MSGVYPQTPHVMKHGTCTETCKTSTVFYIACTVAIRNTNNMISNCQYMFIPVSWESKNIGFKECNINWQMFQTSTTLTYLLHGAKSFLRSLAVSELVKNSPSIYATFRFITTFTSACHLSLYWARSIQSTSPSHFLKIHLTIIPPSMPVSFKRSLSFSSPHQNPARTSSFPHMCYMPRPFHSSPFITQIIFAVGYWSLSSSLCSFLHSSVTSSILGLHVFLSTIFSNTLSPCSSLIVGMQVHAHKKQKAKLQFCITLFLSIRIANWNTKGKSRSCTTDQHKWAKWIPNIR